MNRKDEFDKLMYLLGEENSIEKLNHPIKTHKFSKEYASKKEELINKYKTESGTDLELSVTSSTVCSRKSRIKRFLVLYAASVAILAISITAHGIATRYDIKDKRNEETGRFTMDITPIFKNDKVPEIKVIPEYLPEGYVESENSPGKYHISGSDNTSGITILPAYSPYDFEDIHVSYVEDKTIGGVKAKVLTREGINFKYIIYLLYENEGQVIKIYGYETIPLEELIKVAENIRYEEIPGSYKNIPAFASKDNSSNNKVFEAKNEENIDLDIFGIGEERKDFIDNEKADLSYTVKSIEVLDKAPNLEHKYFCKVENVIDEYDSYLKYINEDGTLKEYERLEREYWAENRMNRETKVVGMKFVYVTVEVTNTSDEDILDKTFSPLMTYIIENPRHDQEGLHIRASNHELQNEARPFYFDKGDYQGTHYYFADFKAKETYEIHLAYAVDEDYIDIAYISFNTIGYSTTDNTRNISMSYIKVAQ